MSGLDFLAGHTTVRLEVAGECKFAEFVADHVFRDVDGSEHLAIVNAERVADEVGGDRRAAGPGLNGLLGAGFNSLLDFFEEVVVDKETFFDGTCHGAKRGGLLLVARLAAVMVNDNRVVRQFCAAARRETLRELAPWRDELLTTTATLGFALTATVRVVDRIHRHTADMGTLAEPAGATGLAERLLVMVAVTDDTDGGAAVGMHITKLTRRHLELRLQSFDTDQLETRTGSARNLRSASWEEFNTMQQG